MTVRAQAVDAAATCSSEAADVLEGMAAALERLRLMDPPIAHLHEPVASLREGAVVRGHHECDAFFRDDVEEEVKDDGAGLFVERAGGFVGEQNTGLVHEGAAEGGALAFAAGELLDALMEAVAEAGALGEVVQARESGGARNAGGDGRDQAVFLEGEIGDEVVELEDKADFVAQEAEGVGVPVDLDAVDGDEAAIRFVETAEEVKQRAFAAAGGAAECYGLAFTGDEVDAVENGDGTLVVALPDVLRAEDNRGGVGDGGRRRHSKRSASTARIRMA